MLTSTIRMGAVSLLVGVNKRGRDAMQVTRVEQFSGFMTPRQLPNNRLDQIGSSPGTQSEKWHRSMVAGF